SITVQAPILVLSDILHSGLARATSLARNFFFQAEDGIRDFHVTGVQTCALPICRARDALRDGVATLPPERLAVPAEQARQAAWRSEERRVGKESRLRRPPQQSGTKARLPTLLPPGTNLLYHTHICSIVTE